jgi:hypothetical protein
LSHQADDMGSATVRIGWAKRVWRIARNVGIFVVALYLLDRFFAEVPMRRYVATCGPDLFERTYVEGPYNERFLHLLEWALQNNSFIYARSDGVIDIPYWAFWNETYDGYEHFSMNVDWKLVTDIARGFEIDGVEMPPPRRLADLIEATEHKYGVFPKRTASGEIIHGTDERFHDSEDACAFMRAAILPDSAQAEPAVRSTDRSAAP